MVGYRIWVRFVRDESLGVSWICSLDVSQPKAQPRRFKVCVAFKIQRAAGLTYGPESRIMSSSVTVTPFRFRFSISKNAVVEKRKRVSAPRTNFSL